jgi:hypothetical protein
MEEDQIFDNIDEVLSNLPDDFTILEEEVNIDLQQSFYKASGDVKPISEPNELVAELIKGISDPTTNYDEAKTLLVRLSLCDSVEAYRALEAYHKNAPDELRDWATLALQQSRMLIHSSLLGEQQVFISTGLGGKKGKLRYFLIFPFFNRNKPGKTQEEILSKELVFFLEKHEGELEEVQFYTEFATATALIPIKAPIGTIIQEIVDECNQYGHYLDHDVLVTNMKKFNTQEINDYINYNETTEG